eukprot:8519504-Pyramimonas_sp.AAC.1
MNLPDTPANHRTNISPPRARHAKTVQSRSFLGARKSFWRSRLKQVATSSPEEKGTARAQTFGGSRGVLGSVSD